ncbi:hypothetical protein [Streptomyces antarcticus]|uniref:hypothetical protein n=1 Tax=Streptomyces antarcticus TaxID=2996458 RepID=UPI00226F1E07|nr:MULTISPECIES: hypothetical protein [unclassified Streptomyces]MCY0942613.1 hypothetical protein [Streptomyces sp. H34-AA3]MCZ4081359.1 hypothetical protein [Streptomyces sp. H34-S5]
MPQRITGTSRLTIGRFLYDWDNRTYCLLAYARHGNMGVVATVPDVNGDAPDLWSIAARHSPNNASHEDIGRWCLCSGWALSSGRPDHWFAAQNQQWTLDVRNTLHEIKPHQYGITAYGWHGAYVGILTPEDPDTRERAHRLLKEQPE